MEKGYEAKLDVDKEGNAEKIMTSPKGPGTFAPSLFFPFYLIVVGNLIGVRPQTMGWVS